MSHILNPLSRFVPFVSSNKSHHQIHCNMTDNKEAKEETADETTEAPAANDQEAEPLPRDVCFGEGGETHKGTMLLTDIIRAHYILLKKKRGESKVPTKESENKELASHLLELFQDGKKIELSGIKDVPRPFLVGKGRFFERAGDEYNELNSENAKAMMVKLIVSQFKTLSEEDDPFSPEMESCVNTLFENSDESKRDADVPTPESTPRPHDVLFLPHGLSNWEDNIPYEHQGGNKHLLFLASQNIPADTNASNKRVEAAFKLVTSQVEVAAGTELVHKTPRYVAQDIKDNQNVFRELSKEELVEFACVFTFEVFLEKQHHGMDQPLSSPVANLMPAATAKPSKKPVGEPTQHDVLFGRGGMTNGHLGNRRFRDIIALHRPDYIRASKMDKPNVARRIVRAIRTGNPPGRFLKKGDDGKWYDVGDRTAAEKTSQGLRERSNAEKRQRSALREAQKAGKEEGEEGKEGEPSPKKAKVTTPTVPYVGVASHLNYTGGIPLSLSMKDPSSDGKSKKKKGKDDEEDPSDSLPPNAVDKNGDILVTNYDILCGRGGMTNHHIGNKRFRDIVALHRPDYVRAPKIQKPSVARVIVRAIRNGDPPGRFLKKDEKTGKWVDIGDKKAAEKTSQALREKTGEEKEKNDGATPKSGSVLAPKAETKEKEGEDKEEAETSEKEEETAPDDEGKKPGKPSVNSVEV
mmetsp:Transcript_93217/g.269205  ORF Transcript_93217/g.269205 Transcript_93217/m.269205 type:complete len:694 (+) Transcript_93217:27-2108(+)